MAPWKQSAALPYLAVLGALLCLTLSPIIVRYAQFEGIPSILIAGSRMLLAAILITPVVLSRYWEQLKHLTRRDVFFLTLTGIWMCLNGILVIISLEHIPVLINQILASTAPIWAALIEVMWLKTRFHPLILVGITLVIGGSLVISLPQFSGDQVNTSLLGIVLALLSAICGAIYTAFGRYSRTKVSTVPYLWIVYGTGGLFALPIMMITQVQITGYSLAGYGWIGVSTIFVQLLGFSGMAFALGYFPATLIVLMTRSVALSSAILAFFLFTEVPSPLQIVGSLILFFGIASAILGQEINRQKLIERQKN